MIYYTCFGCVFADFESAKNKMYEELVLRCEAYNSYHHLYNNLEIKSTKEAYKLINLIVQDNYKETLKIIKDHKNLKHFIPKKIYIKKYPKNNKRIKNCLSSIEDLMKKEIFQ